MSFCPQNGILGNKVLEDSQFLKDKYVLLINPPWNIIEGSIWNKVASCYPSLGLGLLAACLEKCGAKVRIIDMQAQNGHLEDLIEIIRPDLVGITATTILIRNAYCVAEKVKSIWPGVKVVLGGIHPTIKAREVLENPHVDYVIRGEGERSLVMLVKGCNVDEIPGMAYMENGRYKEHPCLDYIENIDELPLPSYHLMPIHLYHPPLGGALRRPSMALCSSRGCPGRCTYCNSAMTRKLRLRSAEKVVEEIEYLMSNHGIKEVTFYDDSFCANRKRVRDICRLLMDRKIRLTWTCMSRINYADEETLELMAKAGCHMICCGVESADEDILNNIKKMINLDRVIPVVKMTQKAGIRMRLSFMFGNPGETRATMERTIRFAVSARPDLVQFNITTPYPGTEMFKWADRKGYLVTKDWSKYDLWNVVMRLPTVTEEEIHQYYKRGYRRFYLSGNFIWRFLISIVKYPILLVQILRYCLNLLRTRRH